MDERNRDDGTRGNSSDRLKEPRPVGGPFADGELDDETFWDKVRRGVVEGYQLAAEKTDVYARIASRRLSIVGITRRIERTYAEIGERVYTLLTQDPDANVSEDSYVKEWIGRVRAAEEELGRKEAEIEGIRRESRGVGPEKPEETKP